MTRNSNRGRDLPRGPKTVSLKPEPDKNSEARAREIALAKKIDRIKKQLAAVLKERGYGQLFGPSVVRTEKSLAKDEKVVLSALAHNIPVHPNLLAEFGLKEDPNPPTNFEHDGEAPF